MSQTKETFEDRLLPVIVGAVPSHRRQRRLKRVGAVAVVLATTLAVGVLSFGPAVGTNMVSVSAKDAVADPAATEHMLRHVGIDATIVIVPVSPYWHVLDRTWWWLHFDGPVPMSQHDFANLYRQVGDGLVGLTASEADHGTGIQHMPVLELPRDLPGHITLFAAKVVRAGTPVASDYDLINELSPLGTFWCDRLNPNDPTALGDALRSMGYDVIWMVEPQDQNAKGSWPVVATPPSGTVVTWAWLRGPHTVDVRLMTSGEVARQYQRDEGTFLPGETPPWAPSCPGTSG